LESGPLVEQAGALGSLAWIIGTVHKVDGKEASFFGSDRMSFGCLVVHVSHRLLRGDLIEPLLAGLGNGYEFTGPTPRTRSGIKPAERAAFDFVCFR